MISKRFLTCAGLLTLAAMPCVRAGNRPVIAEFKALPQISAAQEMQKKGDFQTATALLQRDLAQYPVTKETQQARLQLDFALGSLHEQEASKRPADANALLSVSKGYYQAILREQPNHEGATRNLALVCRRLGQRNEAMNLLSGAIGRGADTTGALSMQVGELHAQAANWSLALASYTAAAEKSHSEVARRRMVQAGQHVPVEATPKLLAVLPAWEFESPGVAKMGYESIMRTAGARPGAEAARSLMLWADLAARKDSLSPETIQSLPAGWTLAARLGQWMKLMQDPNGGLPEWVTGNDKILRHVLARLSLTAGTEHLRAGKPQVAAAAWQLGLKVAPDLSDYDDIHMQFPSFDLVKADLIRELAFLYDQYPRITSGRTGIDELAGLRQDLFSMKTNAYLTENAEAVQRLHTALGLIYDKMGVWGSPADPENARFQLSRALETADRREEATGFYQPLPDVSRKLAEGLRKAGASSEAAQDYLRAAQGCLDTDQLDAANEMLRALASLDVRMDEQETARGRDAQEALAIRRSIASMDQVSSVVLEDRLSRMRSEIRRRLLEGPLRSGRTPFVARQRFKIFSDLARLTRQAGVEGSFAAECAGDALRQGLDHPMTLVGPADLARLKEDLAVGRKEASGRVVVDVRRTRPAESGGRVWQLFVPGEYSPMFVLVRSADIASLTGPQP